MQAEDAIHSLRESLTKGLTGCLTSHGGGAYRVFLMQGDILAAHGPDDGIWIVRRLVNNGAITEAQGRQVIFYLGQGYRLEELLLDQVPDKLFLDLLGERFRQNLLDFSFTAGAIQFEKMDAIFVDNIQVGHDSNELIEDIVALRDRIAPLRRQMDHAQLHPGVSRPQSRREARLLDLCQGLTRLDELIVTSPYEEGPTLDLIQRMLDNGALEVPSHSAPTLTPEAFEPDEPGEPGEPPTMAPPMLFDDDDDDISEDPADSAPVTSDPAGLDYFDNYNDPPRNSEAEPEPELAPVPDDLWADEDDSNIPEPVAPASAVGDVEEEEEYGDDPFFAVSDDEVRNPLGYDVEAEEEVMGLFNDNDYFRGGGQGQFSVKRELLDRVDLSVPLVESKPPEDNSLSDMIELGDAENLDESERESAHSMSFGPPPIEVMEQRRKVSVCNEVLVELTQALDQTHGSGSGRAFIQLLLDGTPHQYAVLFMGVEIGGAGQIDADHVVRNLQRRPPSERRRLLNLGVLDLINRALSSGSEELTDEMLDQLLSSIAGYQMRIGL